MSSDIKQPAFTAPIERQTFAGVLLDLDGTLVDSKDAIIKHWHKSFNLTKLAGTIHDFMLIFFFFSPQDREGTWHRSQCDSSFSTRQEVDRYHQTV